MRNISEKQSPVLSKIELSLLEVSFTNDSDALYISVQACPCDICLEIKFT